MASNRIGGFFCNCGTGYHVKEKRVCWGYDGLLSKKRVGVVILTGFQGSHLASGGIAVFLRRCGLVYGDKERRDAWSHAGCVGGVQSSLT